IYLEPLTDLNKAAIGYDMYTEPVRRIAMDFARDNGLPALSGKVTLVQEIYDDKQPGFLMYLPLYKPGTVSLTAEQRKNNLTGYVYMPFRAYDFFKTIYENKAKEVNVVYSIYNGNEVNENELLYTSNTDL